MRRRYLIALVLGIALAGIGILIGAPSSNLREETLAIDANDPTFVRVRIPEPIGLLSPRDGNLWLGAGAALILTAAAGTIADRRGRRSTSV